MTTVDARQAVLQLASYFPGKRLNPATLDLFAEEIEAFDAEAAQAAVLRLGRTRRFFPSLAELRDAIMQGDAVAHGAAPDDVSPRLEEIVMFRGWMEDHRNFNHVTRELAELEIRRMEPPVTQAEWDQARVIADARHEAHGRARAKRNEGPPPARPPIRYHDVPPSLDRDVVRVTQYRGREVRL